MLGRLYSSGGVSFLSRTRHVAVGSFSSLCTLSNSATHTSPGASSPRKKNANLHEGPGIDHFLRAANSIEATSARTAVEGASSLGRRQVYLETYGCQMNVNDSEVVLSVLQNNGYGRTEDIQSADVILVNTCAIRENAESKIWHRLNYFRSIKKPSHRSLSKRARRQATSGEAPRRSKGPVVGVLGCMAERLKHKLLESDK
ncbi:hypothetical protein CYMTET_42928, partial [Cymbomonas tetramitiformis]